MKYLNTTAVLDSVQSMIHDDSQETRDRMLVWLNRVLEMITNERDWKVLEKETTLTPTDGAITLPDDYGNVVCIKPTSGSSWFLNDSHRLSQSEVVGTSSNDGVPFGFVETVDEIQLYPSDTAEDVVLRYVPDTTVLEDDETDTIYPQKFVPLLTRSILTWFYEFDMDERLAAGFKLDADELSRLKIWDNGKKAKPNHSKYMRY